MEKINVLHLAHLTIGYGVEKQLIDHLHSVKEEPNEIQHHVCALRIREPFEQELRSLAIPFIITRLWPWDVPKLASFIKEYDIHILHVHNQLRFPLRSRILPKLAGVPLIVEHEHGMIWNTFSNRLIRLTNHLVAKNICNSNATKIMLKQKCGIEAQVIYNGVSIPVDQTLTQLNLKSELGLSANSKIVGFIGRLNTPKGVQAFIRSIPLITKAVPQTVFIVAGDGPMLNELKETAQNLGIHDRVYFLGYQKNVHGIMKQVDVVVVPSIREPFGNVVIEVGLAKKPVVASNVDGIAETVIDGETGFLVDCTEPLKTRSKGASRLPWAVVDGRTRELRPPMLPNIEILAQKVICCLEDPGLALKLGEHAYQRAVQSFSLERYRHNLDQLYRDLVS